MTSTRPSPWSPVRALLAELEAVSPSAAASARACLNADRAAGRLGSGVATPVIWARRLRRALADAASPAAPSVAPAPATPAPRRAPRGGLRAPRVAVSSLPADYVRKIGPAPVVRRSAPSSTPRPAASPLTALAREGARIRRALPPEGAVLGGVQRIFPDGRAVLERPAH